MKIKYAKVRNPKNLSLDETKLVGNELKKIQASESVVTPKAVVAVASNPRSPLHKFFEWDDTEAAQKYREWQARFLICSVFIVDADDESAQPVRAFVNCSPSEDDDEFTTERGYVFTPSIIGKQNYQAQVLEYAKNQLIGWKKRFGAYKEFLGVVKEIEALK